VTGLRVVVKILGADSKPNQDYSVILSGKKYPLTADSSDIRSHQ
jgi:hypothetical protein